MSLLLKALALKLIAGRTVGGVFGLMMMGAIRKIRS